MVRRRFSRRSSRKSPKTTLFFDMKGTKEMPKRGFSSSISKLLTDLQLPYLAVNVLDSPDRREGIKELTGWPTIPQLYVKGEFVGGYEIVRESSEAGELEDLLKDKGLLPQG